ncbi:LysR family transcriptional regulator [Sphingomonas spermidinifaciens]|uniref:LysR family transcriptional regulator n=1 Tax=Sphingomonas spermidinifaciens TaxID=1141889 RepID=A0A2A4B3I9_9SPHN|nr:LysR family transcriptional regulator [Sphingomonas spermidinifaciens]PCD03763.1 LysR family transcriptional regulator [Sphingomonas spermidinifaciens]
MQPPDWNDLRIFLAIARGGQIARAARALGVDATTIGRRLRKLERDLGQRLFEQTRDGQALTQAGERLLAQVEAMQAAADAIGEPGGASGLSGTLRISVSEGFGTWYLSPRIADFAAQHPGLTLDLAANSGFLSPSKRETDIAILLARPRAGQVVASRLTDYALGFYAAANYLAATGEPRGLGAVRSRTLVGYVPDLLYAPELRYLKGLGDGLVPRIRSTSINAQAQAIRAGAGLGILPRFIGDADPTLRRIVDEVAIRRTFWLVTHRDNQRLARIEAFKRWIGERVVADAALFAG